MARGDARRRPLRAPQGPWQPGTTIHASKYGAPTAARQLTGTDRGRAGRPSKWPTEGGQMAAPAWSDALPSGSLWRLPRPGLAAAPDDIGGAVDNVRGQRGERAVVVARVSPQHEERLVRGHAMPFGQNPLGLLDHDSAVQRGLQLLGDKLLLADRSFLQYPDGGDIYQRPGRPRRRLVQAVRCGAEKVECPDDLITQPHRDGVHSGKTHLVCGGGKSRPPLRHVGGADIADGDDLSAAEAVDAGALIVLNLKQFRHPGLLGRCCHQPQRAAAIG